MSTISDLNHDAGSGGCSVIIVDDDADALEEYAEIAHSLGYDCLTASDAYAAMKTLAENPRIGIVITDLKMPVIDGLSFLDELDTRIAKFRPIVSVVITGYGTFDSLVEAMRFNARDFLQKPVTKEALAAVLRRASRTWNQIAFSFRTGGATGEAGEDTSLAFGRQLPPGKELTDREILQIAKNLVRRRERRGEFLDPELFSDPSWDILLDLTAAKLEGIAVPVSSACAATRLPLSTALRYVRSLVDAGFVRRWKDPTDRRRDLLEIEEPTLDSMRRYLSTLRP